MQTKFEAAFEPRTLPEQTRVVAGLLTGYM